MVIELSGVQFGSKSNERFKIAQPRSGSAICNRKFDFELKLHNTKFNYHLIISILKSNTLYSKKIIINCKNIVYNWKSYNFSILPETCQS